MKVTDFDYKLEEKYIAQTPLEHRSDSKLLILDKVTGEIKHEDFKNIANYLTKDDILVINNSRVIPARLFGVKEDSGAKIELLLLNEIRTPQVKALVKPGKRVKIGTVVVFGEGLLRAKCVDILKDGIFCFKLTYEGILLEILEELGTMPLPPYIHETLDDQERYQTVYAKVDGSVAAPTAGLHFTDKIFNELRAKGVQIAEVTLHVGLGTFRPMSVEDVDDHIMHAEYYELDEKNACILRKALKNKCRIVSVGTTSTRVLETIYEKHHDLVACSGYSEIFIYPGYEFKVVTSLITNFHLPKSTLLMLVSALSTKENIFRAYEEAKAYNYRFFSFGDSMFIK